MKLLQIIFRLRDKCWPWSLYLELESAHKKTVEELNIIILSLQRERDTAQRQFAETKEVNLHNARAHRATEVAMLQQNYKWNRALDSLLGRKTYPELPGKAATLHFHHFCKVEQPKQETIKP